MPESKRIFAKGKMNRDIDDRLLPEGEYRDALNVNVGKSEGGDIGAVENLKGNELIPNQGGITGTTIGVIRDPNEDRVYWFNAGETNAIYEYDQSTGNVQTILADKASRTAPQPTCAPETRAQITNPDGNGPIRPAFNALPDPPLGYCNSGNANNNGERADGSTADTNRDFVDNSICVFPPTWDCSGDPDYNCNERTDGGGAHSSLADCQNNCNDPGGGGAANEATVTGCPTGAQTVGSTVTLTVTIANFSGTGDVTVTITNGPTVTIPDGSNSATFDVTSSSAGSVTYTPAASGRGGVSVRNTPCTIGWGAAPVTPMYRCDGSTCIRDDNAGTFTEDTCGGTCVSTPQATCNNYTLDNSVGHARIEYSYTPCAQAMNGNCGTIQNAALTAAGRTVDFCATTTSDTCTQFIPPVFSNPTTGDTSGVTLTSGATCT